MSALVDSRAPENASYVPKPNYNGQIFTIFSLNLSGFSSIDAMNPSNSNTEPSRFPTSNEIASDIGLNKPGLGSGKAAFGAASTRSKPRLVKLRRHTSSNNTRSVLSSENAKIDSGFNPFRSISDNSIPSFTGPEIGSSVSGNPNYGNVGNEGFVFGVSRENSSSNLNSNVVNSSGFVGTEILDDIRKLKIGSEPEFVSASNPVLNLNASNRESSSRSEGSVKEVPVVGSAYKRTGIDESAVSGLPEEIKKLNIEGSGNVENSKKVEDVNSKFSEHHSKTHFSFGSGNVTSAFGTSVASELRNELKKLNIEDAGEVDGDNMKKFVFGDLNKEGTFVAGSSESILRDKMKNLNMKVSVNTYGGEKKETNFNASEKSGFVFGSTRGESMLSDEMVKLKIASQAGDNTGNIFEVRSMDRPEKMDEVKFASSWDGMKTLHVELTTPSQNGNVFTGLGKKVEFSSTMESAKGGRLKKKRAKLKKPTSAQQWLGQDFGLRKSSPQEHAESFDSYSPMDVSPYQETLADNRSSRETSMTSEDAFYPYIDTASTESGPTVPNDATDEDLVAATQRLDIDEGDVKCMEMKEEGSEHMFRKGGGAEGPSEDSVLAAETESFVTAAELFDYSSDTFVTAADTEVSSGLRIEKQDSDGSTDFSFASASEDVGGTRFMFSASSSAQGQSSAAMRHQKKKNRVKGVHDLYGSAPNTKVPHTSSSMMFFPLSETTSPLSPRRGQKGDLPTSFSKRVDKFVAVKEEETKQSSTATANIAAQEACEKWRLRGNQAYANGDMSRAEEYYTQGVNCVSENENSRTCLRALMLCYSNRAATRMSLGRMREALKDCIKAVAMDPSFLRVQVRAANCYLALGEVEDASLHFMKCLQSGSEACVDRKLVLEASEGLEKAQNLSECMKQSAELLKRRTSSDAESALGVIAQALTISSNCEKLLEMKADALFMLRKYEELIQLCEQTLGSAEMNSPAISSDVQNGPSVRLRLWRWRLIIKSYFSLGRLEEAHDFLKKQEKSISTTEESESKNLESLIPLAGTIRELVHHKAAGNEAFQAGKHAEAAEHYTAALSCTVDSRPFAAVCFCNRAAAYKAMGQIVDAIADCSLAIALDGNYGKAISRRATLFEMIRDYEQASRDLQRLVSLLVKQVEDKANQSGASDRISSANELRQAQQRLSAMEEEARKEIPLNMYLILGIDPSVTVSEIKKAYRKAALRHHPDKAGQPLARTENGDDGVWKEIVEEVHKDADRLFKMIGEAYAVLSDPTKRSRYDLEEEMRNVQKRGNGGSSTSRMHTDAQNYPFERSFGRRQWREVWKSYGNSQSRGSEANRSSRY